MLITKCKYCGKDFESVPSYVSFRIKNGKNAPMFCSKKCFGLNKKITDKAIVDKIIREYKEGRSSIEISKDFNISDSSVRNILKRNSVLRRTQRELMLGEKNPTRGKGHSKKTRELLKKITNKRYKDSTITQDKIRIKTLEQISSGRMPKSNTSIEKIMAKTLVEMKIPFEFQKIYGFWVFDFFLPNKKTFIECDGDYWHGNPDKFKIFNKTQKNNISRGKAKDNYAKKHGYKVIRFWESEINEELENVKKKILCIK